MAVRVGTIGRLWRYPVKSMGGERCDTLILQARGVAGDRLFALRDTEGKLGSGKSTRRFRQIDGLLDFEARGRGDEVQIRFPDGRLIGSDAPEIHAALSAALRRDVVLAREAAVPHLDAGPVHLLTSASLAWLRNALPDTALDERRFRPNLFIDMPGDAPIEQYWLGKTLRIGPEVRLRVSVPTERCGMIARAQAELPDAPHVLRHIAQEAALRFGVYAEVDAPGLVRLGDPVVLDDVG